MLGRTIKPNRSPRPFARTDNDSDEPLKKPKTIGNPETCLNCPYKDCKRGWCERVTKYQEENRKWKRSMN